MKSKSLPILGALAVLAALACLPGCNVLGPIFLMVHGPEKQPRQYALDPKRSVVVFVDDRSNVLPRRSLRQMIGEAAQKQLIASGEVQNVIDCRGALAAAARDKFDQPQSIVDIARSVQAEILIYASIEQFTLSADGQSMSPEASVWVKVIDAVSEKRLWPEDEKSGKRIAIHPQFEQGFVPKSQADVAKAENAVAERLGIAIAQLFYEHEQYQSELRP